MCDCGLQSKGVLSVNNINYIIIIIIEEEGEEDKEEEEEKKKKQHIFKTGLVCNFRNKKRLIL
jgi:hypothetical protein